MKTSEQIIRDEIEEGGIQILIWPDPLLMAIAMFLAFLSGYLRKDDI